MNEETIGMESETDSAVEDVDEDAVEDVVEHAVATSATTHVVLDDVDGDVCVEGWDQLRVSVDVDTDEDAAAVVTMVDEVCHLHLPDDAVVHVPYGASLEAHEVAGDMTAQAVRGTIELGGVGGDVALSDVGSTTVGAVGGDLAASKVGGGLTVQTVGGDASVRDGGDVVIQAVGGDATVRHVGGVTLGSVGGDLAAETVAADLSVDLVGGDAVVRDVQGAVHARRLGADLRLARVTGDVEATAGGDVRLDLVPTPGRTYAVAAGASIRCHLPVDANVDVAVTSAGTVRLDRPGEVGERIGGMYKATLGTGGSTLNLVAGGSVDLRTREGGGDRWGDLGADFTADFGDWAEELAGRMRVHAVRVADEVGTRLSRVAETIPDVLIAAGMSSQEADRIAARVQQAAERAAQHTQRVARHAERQAEHAQRWAEQQAARAVTRAGSMRVPRPPRPPRPETPTAVVSDEERLIVLRLLEQGKITVDEAERLLGALSGRSA